MKCTFLRPGACDCHGGPGCRRPAGVPATPRKFGAVDFERWRKLGLMGGRVLVDGVDVTDRCRWFNDINGRAECYALNEQGRPFVRDDAAEIEILHGHIEIVLPDGWAQA